MLRDVAFLSKRLTNQNRLFIKAGFKETGTKTEHFRQGVKRGAAPMYSIRKIMCLNFNFELQVSEYLSHRHERFFIMKLKLSSFKSSNLYKNKYCQFI